jgi:leader peptidase (prepilin peptidase)/N-methyltransferase
VAATGSVSGHQTRRRGWRLARWATIFAVIELATVSAVGAYIVSGYLNKHPLKATAFLPFGLFLAPAIWIGWLVEAMLG